MSADWPEISLTDIYDISSGLSKSADSFGSGYPFLSFKDVFGNFFLPNRLSQLVESNEKERLKGSILRGDVFLTRTSETMHELGMSSVALKNYKNATFNGFTKRLRPKESTPCKVHPEYIGYYLRSRIFRTNMLAFSTMSTRASLNNEMIGRLTIKLPPLKIQQYISKILKTLDDKIELNRQTNQTLEHLAQAIFKSWFVDFEPTRAKIAAKANGEDPERAAMAAIAGKTLEQFDALFPDDGGHESTHVTVADSARDTLANLKATAALFPERLVESELGEVPEGWGVKSLVELAHYQNGLALQKFRPENINNFLPVLKIAQLKKGYADGSEKASPNIKSECIVSNGDMVFSWSGSLLIDVWCGGKAALNQHLFKVTSEHYPKWFYYYWTKQHLESFQQIAADKAVTMGHIKRSHLTEAKCAVPSGNLDQINVFSNLLDKLIEQRLENNTLEQLRDTLLPKLLSGEINLCEAP